jgi:hypothetical protein
MQGREAMERNPNSESGHSNLRILLALGLCSVGAILTILSLAAVPVICVDCGGNPNEFLVRSYQGRSRCLDYTPEVVGSPIFVNDCKQAHPIVIEDLKDGKHTVVLHAGTKVIGVKTILSTVFAAGGGTPSAIEAPLVLQNPSTSGHVRTTLLASNQHFALDGDSIILSSSMPESPTSNPILVAKIHNARGAIGTPVVLGPRNLADNEFWDFLPTNGIDHDPTSGFVRVSTSLDLATALLNATTGTVIKVDPAVSINVFPSGAPYGNPYGTPITVPGVTVRGDRRGTNLGPELVGPYQQDSDNLFLILADNQGAAGHYARITGMRVRGPSRSTDQNQPAPGGIHVGSQSFMGYIAAPVYKATIDHNDISDWPGVATGTTVPDASTDSCVSLDPNAPPNAYIGRNFIHHNEKKDLGYGVGTGGKVMVAGNTFLMNRHCISGSGEAHETYTAWFNLVLSNVPVYGSSREQDFDMHGTGCASDKNSNCDCSSPGCVNGYKGIAGNKLDIGWNTFLGGNRINFEIRGYPCARDYFHDNVSEQYFVIGDEDDDDALFSYYTGVIKITGESFPAGFSAPYVPYPYPQELWVFGNQWAPSYTDPTIQLRVGDFDGDGIDDLFLATGRGWYFSPGGVAEWRFLSAKTEKVDQLLFGDFDGDGRTDVVTIGGGYLYVSWGGISDWELLNPNTAPGAITDMAVGDFIGDKRSDIFFSDGTSWYLSDGGSGPFVFANTSSFRVKDLRFGDFDGDGKTDVFGVVAGTWSYSKSAGGSWSDGYLRQALTSNANDLIVADFNGDGIADVALTNSTSWSISYSGTSNWNSHSEAVPLNAAAGIGHFLGNPGVDVLLWNDYGSVSNVCDANAAYDVLCIVSGGGGTPQRQSRQEMR